MELFDAVRRGDVESVRAFLECGADVNALDADGATALHYAAESGNRSMASLLIEHGADVNARDVRFGATPAGWAIEYLRNAGGFLGIELDDLAYAIGRRDAAWVERLLERFPNLRFARAKDGVTFRELAARCGEAAIAKLFD